jgi:hypothetical protein
MVKKMSSESPFLQNRASAEFAADAWAPDAISFSALPAGSDAHDPPPARPALRMAAVGRLVATFRDLVVANDDVMAAVHA